MTAIGFKMGGEIGGTSLCGYIDVSYADLVGCFGQPTCDGDGYKVDAEWIVTFADGVVATIYNYKDGPNYCGSEGTPVESIRDWHVGGYPGTDAVGRVEECLGAYRNKVVMEEPRTFEKVIAQSKPLVKKEYAIDMGTFRSTLTTMQNAACDIVEAIRQRDGTIPREKLIEYTVAAAEAKVLDKIAKALDYSKV